MHRVIKWLGCQSQPTLFQTAMAWVVILSSAVCLYAAIRLVMFGSPFWVLSLPILGLGVWVILLVRVACFVQVKTWEKQKALPTQSKTLGGAK